MRPTAAVHSCVPGGGGPISVSVMVIAFIMRSSWMARRQITLSGGIQVKVMELLTVLCRMEAKNVKQMAARLAHPLPLIAIKQISASHQPAEYLRNVATDLDHNDRTNVLCNLLHPLKSLQLRPLDVDFNKIGASAGFHAIAINRGHLHRQAMIST